MEGFRFCDKCQKQIDREFVLRNGRFYHPECLEKTEVHRCHVCHQNLPQKGNRVSWCEHPFWKEKFCSSHNHDGTPRCASCERLKPNGHSILENASRCVSAMGCRRKVGNFVGWQGDMWKLFIDNGRGHKWKSAVVLRRA